MSIAEAHGARYSGDDKGNAMTEMTGTEFSQRAAAALGGHGWKTLMAKALGKNQSTVRRWVSGEEPVPAYAVAALELLEAVPTGFRPMRWLKARGKD